MPTIGTGRSSFAAAYIRPNTAIAPHLSKTIRPIFSAGLIEMPPVSKVMALPTTRRGEWPGARGERDEFVFPRPLPLAPCPWYSNAIILGGVRFDPAPT